MWGDGEYKAGLGKIPSGVWMGHRPWSHLHWSSAICSCVAHNNTFWHTSDTVVLPEGCRIKQVVRCLFEWGKHQNAVLHFCDTKASDTKNLSLCAQLVRKIDIAPHSYFVAHDIAKQHNMTGINAHSVALHGILDFVDYGPSRCFNPQDFCWLNYMIGSRSLANNPYI